MTGTGRRVARTATLVAAGVQVAAVVALVAFGIAEDGPVVVDWLHPVPIVAIYVLPAVLAVMAVRGRSALLLVAAVTALVLAVFPFSLQSFFLGPVGLVYLASYPGLPRGSRGSARGLVAAAVCPLLAVAALLVLFLQDDPACYTQRASGEVTVDRNPSDVTSGHVIPAESNIVSRGCTSDTVVWWEAAGSLALSAAAVTAALKLVPPHSLANKVKA